MTLKFIISFKINGIIIAKIYFDGIVITCEGFKVKVLNDRRETGIRSRVIHMSKLKNNKLRELKNFFIFCLI